MRGTRSPKGDEEFVLGVIFIYLFVYALFMDKEKREKEIIEIEKMWLNQHYDWNKINHLKKIGFLSAIVLAILSAIIKLVFSLDMDAEYKIYFSFSGFWILILFIGLMIILLLISSYLLIWRKKPENNSKLVNKIIQVEEHLSNDDILKLPKNRRDIYNQKNKD